MLPSARIYDMDTVTDMSRSVTRFLERQHAHEDSVEKSSDRESSIESKQASPAKKASKLVIVPVAVLPILVAGTLANCLPAGIGLLLLIWFGLYKLAVRGANCKPVAKSTHSRLWRWPLSVIKICGLLTLSSFFYGLGQGIVKRGPIEYLLIGEVIQWTGTAILSYVCFGWLIRRLAKLKKH